MLAPACPSASACNAIGAGGGRRRSWLLMVTPRGHPSLTLGCRVGPAWADKQSRQAVARPTTARPTAPRRNGRRVAARRLPAAVEDWRRATAQSERVGGGVSQPVAGVVGLENVDHLCRHNICGLWKKEESLILNIYGLNELHKS